MSFSYITVFPQRTCQVHTLTRINLNFSRFCLSFLHFHKCLFLAKWDSELTLNSFIWAGELQILRVLRSYIQNNGRLNSFSHSLDFDDIHPNQRKTNMIACCRPVDRFIMQSDSWKWVRTKAYSETSQYQTITTKGVWLICASSVTTHHFQYEWIEIEKC